MAGAMGLTYAQDNLTGQTRLWPQQLQEWRKGTLSRFFQNVPRLEGLTVSLTLWVGLLVMAMGFRETGSPALQTVHPQPLG